MKPKVIAVILLVCLAASLLIGYANAASITASISAQIGGFDVVTATQGATIQLVSSCSVTPATPVTGTVSYKYSIDGTVWGPVTPITTYASWDGAEKTTDFILTDAGNYAFYIDVITEGSPPHASASQFYPSTGTFNSEPPLSNLPEAPPLAGLAMGFAAVGLFVVAAKKKKPKIGN